MATGSESFSTPITEETRRSSDMGLDERLHAS
jgi:hypothetical protein